MHKKILVVDDSKVSRMFVLNYWRNINPDWEFYEANCGEQALSLTAQHQFYAVILDYNMPDMNGLDVAKKVLLQQKNCFIALLTANVQRHIQEEAEQATLYFYSKPINPDLIQTVIQHMEDYHNALQ